MKVCLVTRRLPPARCGIGDYTLALASALARDHETVVVTGTQTEVERVDGVDVLPVVPDWGFSGMRVLIDTLRTLQPDWVVVEYVPFLYSRIGVNFWLPLAICRMRAAGLRVLLTVHEPFVEMNSAKHALMGAAQRVMMWLLGRGSAKIAVTTHRWEALIAPFTGNTEVFCVPVGSPFSPVQITSAERERLRAALGIGDTDVVVATLRPTGAGKQWPSLLGIWQRLHAAHPKTKLLVVGVTEEERPLRGDASDVIDAGYVAPQDASRLLSCADVFLTLFVDGVSTRRTSVMAAMAHALPVVTTGSVHTDDIFAASPVMTCAVGRDDELVAVLDELMRRPDVRRQHGGASREFYARHFDWPVLASRLSAELRESA